MISSSFVGTAFRNYHLERFVIPIALIALCVWAGQATPDFHIASFDLFTVVLVGVVGTFFIILSLRNLQFGLFAITVAAFLVHFSLGTGSATRIPSSMMLTVLMLGLWLVSLLMRRRLQLAQSAVNIPLFGFIIASIISLPWSWQFSRPDLFVGSYGGSGTPFQIVQMGGLALMVFLPLLFLLSLNIMRDRKWIMAVFAMIIIAGAIALVADLAHVPRSSGLLNVNTGGLFSLWMVSLTYSQVLFNDQLKPWQRLLFGALAAGWLFKTVGLDTTWFSGWMPAMLSVLFLTFRKSRKLTFIMMILLAIPFLMNPDYFYQRIWVKAQLADWNRFTIWPTVIGLALQNTSALFGAGPVGYIPLYRSLVVGPAFSAHSNYVDIFAETGIVGFSFFAWFLFSVFRTGWTNGPKLDDGFLRAFNNGALGALVGTMFAMILGDWFIPFVYNIGYAGFDYNAYAWISLGAMVGLQRLTKGAPEPAATDTAKIPAAAALQAPAASL